MVAPKLGSAGMARLLAAPVDVRIASSDDAAAIAAMTCAARTELSDHSTSELGASLAEVTAQTADLMQRGQVLYVLATRLGVPIGFLRCRCGDRTWVLEQMYVAPSHRCNGIPGLLLAEIDSRANRCGLDSASIVISLQAS